MGALGRFYRKLSESKGINLDNYHKKNRAISGLNCRRSGNNKPGLIYGMQGAWFNNSPPAKPWQTGAHYENYVVRFRPLNMNGYTKLSSGQIIKNKQALSV